MGSNHGEKIDMSTIDTLTDLNEKTIYIEPDDGYSDILELIREHRDIDSVTLPIDTLLFVLNQVARQDTGNHLRLTNFERKQLLGGAGRHAARP